MNFESLVREKLYWYRAQVFRAVDGDTLEVLVDHGMHVYSLQRLRLLGVDTPEVRGEEREEGLAAKVFVEKWIASLEADKRFSRPVVYVRTLRDTRSFNRYIASVYSPDGTSLRAEIITAGHDKLVR